MADFVAVLKKTIGGLSSNTPEMREKVYQKARDTVAAKLAAMQPPPSSIVVERQKKALEDAITAVESGYERALEPEDEFAAIFSGTADKRTKTPEITPEPEPEPSGPVSDRVDYPARSVASDPAADTPDKAEAADEEKLTPVKPAPRPDPVLAGSFAAGDKGAASESATPPVARPPRRRTRRASGGLIAAVIALLVIAAAGYGVWLNRDAFVAMFQPVDVIADAPAENGAEEEEAARTASDLPEAETPAEQTAAAEEPAAPEPAGEVAAAPPPEEQEKFTQRLTAEGEEIDPGPAGGEATVGEGTSVAAATQTAQNGAGASTATDASPDAGAQETALPVGQRAIFYEERTTISDSTAETGSTVWSVVQESPGGDMPPEPAIRAEVTVPSKDLQLRMTIRRNGDPSLPASHIIEMIFLTPEGFEGGGIDNVLRVAFKPTEAAPGNPLMGIPAKIADGYFLIALSDTENERNLNLQLMRQQSWIDIPIVYSTGRRALVTMERGVPGDRVFIDVLETWKKLASEEAAAAPSTAGN